MHSRIAGTGGYLPAQIVTNADLAQRIDTNDEWVRTRTGICQRLGCLGRGDVAGHDLDAVRQALHPLDRRSDFAVVAVGGVDDDAVDAGLD